MIPAFALVVLAALPPAQASPTATDRWVGLVLAHQPGVRDAALLDLGNWGGTYLKAALDGLKDYAKQFEPAIRDGAMNNILERGAVSHMDLAMLAPRLATRFTGLPGWRPQRAMRSADGFSLDARVLGAHWRLGRLLLKRVAPEPYADPVVRAWHEAVAAHLLADRDYADALQHFKESDGLCDSDPGFCFFGGVLHEVQASSEVQEVVGSLKVSTGVRSGNRELETAARHFERALRGRPDHVEAQLHLGRVLHLLGRNADAEPHLARAAEHAQDPVLQYYAVMMLGAVEEAQGALDAARARYEKAATLQPTAQSPLIALSHLARERGQTDRALALIQRLMTLPSGPDGRRDPWPDYGTYAARTSGALLSSLYAALQHPSPP